MGLTLTTPPAEEPVTVDELKAHANIETDEDDTIIATYLKAARAKTEHFTWRQFVEADYTLTLDRFPTADYIDLPRPPLVSVESIEYYDTAGTLQTLSESSYSIDAGTEPGRIYIDRSVGWPSVADRRNAVSVLYTAGYGGAEDVPDDIKLSILMKAAHWYENREEVIVGVSVAPIPGASASLDELNKFRCHFNVNVEEISAPI